jgi:uncharacterized protein (TIGR03437 family)
MPQWVTVPVMWVNAALPTGPVVTSVGNALSFTPGVSPGMLMAVYGTQLGNSTQTAQGALDNSLAGVSATVNGWPAPLLYVSPSQINIQVPYETGAGPAVLGINNNGQVGGFFFQVAPSAPGILGVSGATAKRGGYATVYMTGVGDVSPEIQTGISIAAGTPASALPKPVLPLSATVGGVPALVQFAGLIPGMPGVAQVNFQVPATMTPGTQAVVVTVNGVSSVAVDVIVQ